MIVFLFSVGWYFKVGGLHYWQLLMPWLPYACLNPTLRLTSLTDEIIEKC